MERQIKHQIDEPSRAIDLHKFVVEIGAVDVVQLRDEFHHIVCLLVQKINVLVEMLIEPPAELLQERISDRRDCWALDS